MGGWRRRRLPLQLCCPRESRLECVARARRSEEVGQIRQGLFWLDPRRSTSAGGNLPYEQLQKTEILNPGNPKIIAPGMKATARIHVAETNEQLRAAKLKLRLQFRKAPAPERLSVRLNGIVLRPLSVEDQWLECDNIAGALHKGANNVEVTSSSHENKQTTWTDLMLEIRHLEGASKKRQYVDRRRIIVFSCSSIVRRQCI